MAGAGVAYALRDAPVSVTVFERTDRIGGRAATRSVHGCTYDLGVNYVKSDDSGISELLTETLDTNGLIDITEPVWTFTEDRTISSGDDSDVHKWSYTEGIAALPRRLFDRSDTPFRLLRLCSTWTKSAITRLECACSPARVRGRALR